MANAAGKPQVVRLGASVLDFAVFLVPALQFIQINLIGSLYASDFVLASLGIGLFFRRRPIAPLNAPIPKKFLLFGSFWLTAQIVTDVVRHTPFHDYARGWAFIVVTLLTFSVLYILLVERPQRIIVYGWGLVVGTVLSYFFNPFYWAKEYPWEGGWGLPVTLAVFLLARGEHYRDLWLPTAIGVANVFLGYRSMGAACLFAAIYLFLKIKWSRDVAWRTSAMKPRFVISTILVFALGTWGMSIAYKRLASSGALGAQAQWKYEFQSKGQFGLLLGGRSEMLLGAMAIYGSPWLGHGSWAKSREYVAAYQAEMLALGYSPAAFQRGVGTGIGGEENDYLIVAHSHILGAWIEAGIVGAFFFVWLLTLTVRFLKLLFLAKIPHVSLFVFFAFWVMWNLCFEPYGGVKRFSILYFVISLVVYLTLFSKPGPGAILAPAAPNPGKR